MILANKKGYISNDSIHLGRIKSQKRIDEMRGELKLSPLENVDRFCLRCNIKFTAMKKVGNFLCDCCRICRDTR